MKQNITKQQWAEVHGSEYYQKFRNAINITEVRIDIPFHEYITIGKMIEFLGEDFRGILRFKNNYQVRYTAPNEFCSVKLADALWEAVKFKLNAET